MTGSRPVIAAELNKYLMVQANVQPDMEETVTSTTGSGGVFFFEDLIVFRPLPGGSEMVDTKLLPAIRQAIHANELGSGSPYCLSYAKLGKSGASFGIFQGDTHVNSQALDVLRQVLEACNCDPIARGGILTRLGQACPHGSPLTSNDAKLCDDALCSDEGKRLVDAMDEALFQVVLKHLDQCNAAAATKGWSIDPVALLYIALWTNMTGAPGTLCKWLSGEAAMGLGPPSGPRITQADMEHYLRSTSYFIAHPKNFAHMQESVASGAKLLPKGQAAATT